MSHRHTINSRHHSNTNNNSVYCDQDNTDRIRGDDKKDNHRHTPHSTKEHGIVLEKWTSSQDRKTLDAQSKVYGTGTKKRWNW